MSKVLTVAVFVFFASLSFFTSKAEAFPGPMKFMTNDSVVLVQNRCPEGHGWYNGRCVRDAPAYGRRGGNRCPEGHGWYNGRCVRDAPAYGWRGGNRCPEGHGWYNGSCLPDAPGYGWRGGNRCPEGHGWYNGRCLPDAPGYGVPRWAY